MSNDFNPHGPDEQIGAVNTHNNDIFTLPAGTVLMLHVYDNTHSTGVLDRIKMYTLVQNIQIETKSQPFRAAFLGSDKNPNFEKESLEAEIEDRKKKLSKMS